MIKPNDMIEDFLEEISQQFVPFISQSQSLPENIKKELIFSTHKFLSQSIEIINKRSDLTRLYIPNENFEPYSKEINFKTNEQKEVLFRIEFIVTQWIK